MNIAAEKEELIKRISQEKDEFVIDAVKDLLDFAHTMNDPQLEAELEIALKQSDNREVRPHDVVWAEIRNRYKK